MTGKIYDRDKNEIRVNTLTDKLVHNDIYIHHRGCGEYVLYRQTLTGFEFIEYLQETGRKIIQGPEFGGVNILTTKKKIPMASGNYYTLKVAARNLGITYNRIHKIVSSEKRGIRIGRILILSEEDMQALRDRIRIHKTA